MPDSPSPISAWPGGVIVAIDGRSGSGKSSLAQQWAQQWRAAGFAVELVGLDLVYPGWQGLAQGVSWAGAAVQEWARTGSASLLQWDWVASAPAPPRTIGPADILLVEGVGAAQATRSLAHRVVILEGDEQLRRSRAGARDGDLSWWDDWARQEDAFFTAHPLA